MTGVLVGIPVSFAFRSRARVGLWAGALLLTAGVALQEGGRLRWGRRPVEVRVVNVLTGAVQLYTVPCGGIDRGLGGFFTGGGRARLTFPDGTQVILADVERLELPAKACLGW